MTKLKRTSYQFVVISTAISLAAPAHAINWRESWTTLWRGSAPTAEKIIIKADARGALSPFLDVGNHVARSGYVKTVEVGLEIQNLIGKLVSKDDSVVFLTGPKGVGKSQYVDGVQEKILAKENLPYDLHDAKIFRVDPEHKMASDISLFESSIIDLEHKLPEDAPLIIHITAGDDAEQIAEMVARVKYRISQDRPLKFIIECTESQKTQLKKIKAFADAPEVPVRKRTVDETVIVLKAHLSRLTSGNLNTLPDPILKQAAQMAERYYGDVGLPNGAIKLISRAFGNRMALLESRKVPMMDELQKELTRVNAELEEVSSLGGSFARDLRLILPDEKLRLEKKITDLEKRFPDVFNLKNRRDNLLVDIRKNKEKNLNSQQKADLEDINKRYYSLTEDDLALTVFTDKGVPLEALIKVGKKLSRSNIVELLSARIKGQPHVVEAVADAIVYLDSPWRDASKPISFLFLGPTGTGKTEMYEAIRDIAFEGRGLRLDMSGFQEQHSIARLQGAPPGYIGSDEGGVLTDFAIENKRFVVVWDEAEKAHQKILDLSLQIKDKGELMDSKGRVANFRESIEITTMNLGKDLPENATLQQIVEFFGEHGYRPEFFNRYDEILVFRPLNETALSGIIDKMTIGLNQTARKQLQKIELTDATRKYFLTQLQGTLNSGRDISRIMTKKVRRRLAEAQTQGSYRNDQNISRPLSLKRGDKILVDYNEKDGMTLNIAE